MMENIKKTRVFYSREKFDLALRFDTLRISRLPVWKLRIRRLRFVALQ